jgi:hypothetical protein
VSNHNIAEIPIDIALFVDKFGGLIDRTGGENISLQQFFEFLNDEIVSDPRNPGYGRSSFYKPFSAPKKGEEDKLQAVGNKPEETEKTLSKNLQDWTKKYGDEFVTPVLTFEFESGFANNPTARSKDLLEKLSSRVAAGYMEPSYPTEQNNKTIIKIHIYDRTSSPYDSATKALRLAPDGTYYLVSSAYANDENLLRKINDPKSPDASQIKLENGQYKLTNSGETIAIPIGRGKEAMLEFFGNTVPYLPIGTEGSLITAANLQSKTSGLEGTIALQGGSQRRESSLATTGLSQQQFNLPIIMYPAELKLTSMGCPLASMGQNFFVDFGTNTTIDNHYIVKSVNHSFTPGKFETQWDLTYYDGYGRMISDNDTEGLVKKIDDAIKQQQAAEAARKAAEEAKKPKPTKKKQP